MRDFWLYRMTKKIKILIGLLAILLAPHVQAIKHTYVEHSVLETGNWVKIRVSESGVCKITYDQLAEAGLQPENVRVYGFGGAMLTQNFQKRKIDDLPPVGFWMEKGADNVFNSGDYILFYVTANIGWSFNGTRFTHTRNPYSDYGYYFLSDNAGEQKLLTTPAAAISGTGATEVTSFTKYMLHEVDLVNLLDRQNGINGGGREFYGEYFTPSTVQTFKFSTPNIVISKKMRCYVTAAAAAGQPSTFTVQVGDQQQLINVRALASGDFYTMAETGLCNAQFTPEASTTQKVSIEFSNSVRSAAGYLNYIELSPECMLTLVGSFMPFRSSVNYQENIPLLFKMTEANANTQIWNITHPDDIYLMPSEINGNTLTFVSSNYDELQEFVAVNPKGDDFVSATIIGSIKNQDLHKLVDIDFVIITPEEFRPYANQIAQAHEEKDQMTTAVVTDQEVYNEFSSGTPDATAYRWLMKMLYDRGVGSIHKPSHLLLFGDGTFDNRQLLPASGKAILLTYQAKNSTIETKAYATDDYFGFLDNNEGESDVSGVMDIGVGRLPISTTEEAEQVTNKVLAYMANTSYGNWKQQLLFLADDGDNGLHTQTAEAGAEIVRKKNPNFIVNKVYLDAYPQEVTASGESYPLAKNRLENLLTNGMLYLNYSGHGGYNAITNESLMDLHSIKALNNVNQAMWFFATCSFAHFDSGKRCAAEEAVLNPHGGAIGVLSACRTVYATQNTIINRHFCDTLFGHRNAFAYEMTLGQSTRIAKNKTGVGDENKMPYVLLGDPALKLAYPTQFGVRTTACSDTIRALTVHTVKGEVVDSLADVMTWFNGTLMVTVYDKLQRITTRDNDETNPDKQQLLTYNDYPNIIYRSTVDVVDGKFEFTFMAPKDIRYNYGSGRIVYYAFDSENAAEASGYYEKFIIGGSSSVAVIDTIGPDITLYLNNPAFQNGGETHQTPHFYADLYDENGINTVGSGIGHDLLLIIDKDPQMTYVVNDYFKSTNGDYHSGQVSYKMPELEAGQHSLSFRAWDLFNNSSTKSLNFTVVKDLDLNVFSVTTYPNPVSATGIVNIQIEYDRPDDLVQTDIYIYNMSGQLVWQSSQDDAKTITWNIGELGITPGIYVYRLQLQTQSTSAISQTGKLIVTK